MTARTLDGKRLSEQILSGLKARVEKLRKKGVVPRLDILLVGEDPGSKIYVRSKIRTSEQLGMKGELHRFPEDAAREAVIAKIKELNSDPAVHGILVQLPLPPNLDEQEITDAISPSKDVDGLTTQNMGKLATGRPEFEPCTPKGIIRLLESERIPIEGSHSVVIGRSNIVGKPISMMLMKRNATVTICHSMTKDLKKHSEAADIVVAAVGRARFVGEDMVKKGAVVVDAGINRVEGKVVGDVDFEKVKHKAACITPVPGGVGPLTVAMLIENTIISAERMAQTACIFL